jgi:hypothetical protein
MYDINDFWYRYTINNDIVECGFSFENISTRIQLSLILSMRFFPWHYLKALFPMGTTGVFLFPN